MAIASGVAKQLKYKVESTWGTAPSASGSQLLRRVSSDLSLNKQTYQSEEIVSHYQRLDMRHGVRSVAGTIRGELSAGTYKDFMAAILRKAMTATSAITGASITVAGSGPTYTVTRAAGSFLTDGIKAGDVVKLTAGSFDAANLNKNLLVLSLTATVLTVMPLNGVALTAEGPIASATVSVPGKRSYTPTSGHTDLSYSFEHWFADLSLSEVYRGCKPTQMDINLPATGMSTIALQFMGKDITTAGGEYFTSPTAETETGTMAAVNGLMLAQGSAIALLTGLSFSVRGGHTAEPVVGSNTYADITEGRIVVDGQASVLFSGATERDYFINETEVSLVAVLSASNSAGADFLGFSFPRVKFGSATKDDGEKSLVQTMSFSALLNGSGGSGTSSEETTLVIQDSAA